MLYLVRKKDQSIIINNEIEVKVVAINRTSVKIGLKFPEKCTVLRKEVYDKIHEENKEALSSFDAKDFMKANKKNENDEGK
jgi:carbon storage regulator